MHNMSKTPATHLTAKLLRLAKQYSSDCETRIGCLRKELTEANTTEVDQRKLLEQDGGASDFEDTLDQIDHWQATKDGIDLVIREAEETLPLLAPAKAMHPQRARIECAIGFLRSVKAYWDNDEVAEYPKELPSFDEYVAQISEQLRLIKWQPAAEGSVQLFLLAA